MKNKFFTFLLISAFCFVLSSAPALPSSAGTWILNDTGWWYEFEDGTWPAGTWLWIDGNRDGLAECYYFKDDGYLLTDGKAPDGSNVNADGAWVDQGIVIRRQSDSARKSRSIYEDLPFIPDGRYTASDGRIILVRSTSAHSAQCEFSEREDDLVSKTIDFTLDISTRCLTAPRPGRGPAPDGEIRMWLSDEGKSLWVETADAEGNPTDSFLNGIYRK